MTQEIIIVNGYSLHIDTCLVGAKLDSDRFRIALRVASMERLRRIIADLEVFAMHHKTRIAKLKARLRRLEKVNSQLTGVAAA